MMVMIRTQLKVTMQLLSRHDHGAGSKSRTLQHANVRSDQSTRHTTDLMGTHTRDAIAYDENDCNMEHERVRKGREFAEEKRNATSESVVAHSTLMIALRMRTACDTRTRPEQEQPSTREHSVRDKRGSCSPRRVQCIGRIDHSWQRNRQVPAYMCPAYAGEDAQTCAVMVDVVVT